MGNFEYFVIVALACLLGAGIYWINNRRGRADGFRDGARSRRPRPRKKR